ncbi:MAG: hypothetical protein ACRDPC_27435 [Solirubrobacteraceae bacterium]
MRASSTLDAAREALLRGAFAEARAGFEAALAERETPEALAGLGEAARWQLDADTALAAHERGYRLARAGGDDAAAAQLAVELVFDSHAFRGMAEAQGWLERARRLLDGQPPSEIHAALADFDEVTVGSIEADAFNDYFVARRR